MVGGGERSNETVALKQNLAHLSRTIHASACPYSPSAWLSARAPHRCPLRWGRVLQKWGQGEPWRIRQLSTPLIFFFPNALLFSKMKRKIPEPPPGWQLEKWMKSPICKPMWRKENGRWALRAAHQGAERPREGLFILSPSYALEFTSGCCKMFYKWSTKWNLPETELTFGPQSISWVTQDIQGDSPSTHTCLMVPGFKKKKIQIHCFSMSLLFASKNAISLFRAFCSVTYSGNPR